MIYGKPYDIFALQIWYNIRSFICEAYIIHRRWISYRRYITRSDKERISLKKPLYFRKEVFSCHSCPKKNWLKNLVFCSITIQLFRIKNLLNVLLQIFSNKPLMIPYRKKLHHNHRMDTFRFAFHIHQHHQYQKKKGYTNLYYYS